MDEYDGRQIVGIDVTSSLYAAAATGSCEARSAIHIPRP